MVTIDVNDENPENHWKYINIKPGELAVDFGCGRWEKVEHRDSSWLTTPEFLLSRGAEFVYAFDKDKEEIDWYNETFFDNQSMKFLQRDLSSQSVFEDIIVDLEPNVVKCDIEKNEMHLLNIRKPIFSSVRLYAIETHRDWIFNAFMSEFPIRGYEVTAVINLTHAKPMKVIFAERIERICEIGIM
ncbi:MAG: hypothetical protein WC346_05215 [Methanogenium sp.]|jgi:hypothetical protein